VVGVNNTCRWGLLILWVFINIAAILDIGIVYISLEDIPIIFCAIIPIDSLKSCSSIWFILAGVISYEIVWRLHPIKPASIEILLRVLILLSYHLSHWTLIVTLKLRRISLHKRAIYRLWRIPTYVIWRIRCSWLVMSLRILTMKREMMRLVRKHSKTVFLLLLIRILKLSLLLWKLREHLLRLLIILLLVLRRYCKERDVQSWVHLTCQGQTKDGTKNNIVFRKK